MSDMLKAFGTTGQPTPAGADFKHPMEEDIVRECSALLMGIPEGKRLLAYAREHDINFHVMTGKEPNFRMADSKNLFLLCPANTRAVDLEEMACNMAIGIRNIEQPSIGIPRPTPGIPGVDLEKATFNHMLDIIIEMCKIALEFETVNKSTKLIDLVEKLGHGDINRAIRSGKSQEELAKILREEIKKV